MAYPIDIAADLIELREKLETRQFPGDIWPTEQAFKDARAFLLHLNPIKILPPSMGIAGDGEINFLWKFCKVHIDLGFYGNGTYSYYARDPDGKNYYGDDLSVDEHRLDDPVLNLIRTD